MNVKQIISEAKDRNGRGLDYVVWLSCPFLQEKAIKKMLTEKEGFSVKTQRKKYNTKFTISKGKKNG